jgi:K+-transporting ATPase ATPase C chain
MRELKTAVIAVIAFTLVLGLAYPLVMTGVSQVVFPGRADGSMIERDGKVVGSKLIGQDFSKDLSYFQSRPSVTGYAPAATFFNNQGPNQQALADQLKGYVDAYLKRETPYTPNLTAADIPSDAATTSASGVDPHISEDNADIQANRVAQERGLDKARVLQLIDDNASRPLFGLAGEKSINVLELNLDLDRLGGPEARLPSQNAGLDAPRRYSSR